MEANVTIGKRSFTCSDELLEMLLLGGVVTLTAISPIAAGALGASLVAGKKFHGKSVSNAIEYQKRKERIKTIQVGSNIQITLTESGREYAEKKFVAKRVQIDSKKWDREWRIVVFDLDESKKAIRDMIRLRLKQLGFMQLQRSVWIFPMSVERELNMLRNQFSLTEDEFRLIVAKKIGSDESLRKFFKIQ